MVRRLFLVPVYLSLSVLCSGADFFVSAHDPLTATVSATGGTVVDAGGYRIHTFIANGTFTVTTPGLVEYLVIGGGGGRYGGSGGAGGSGGGGSGCSAPNSAGTAGTVNTVNTVNTGSGGGGGCSDGAGGTGGSGIVIVRYRL